MGFRTSPYEGPDEYGFADRDGAALHLAHSTFHDPQRVVRHGLPVRLGRRRAAPGVDGGRHRGAAPRPAGHPYGLREGAYVDPDGNLLRYGSWLPGYPTAP